MSKRIEEALPPVAAVEGGIVTERPAAAASQVVVVGTDGTPIEATTETAPAPRRRGRPAGSTNNGDRKATAVATAEFKLKLRLEHVQGNTRVIYDRAATVAVSGSKHPTNTVFPIVQAWIEEIDVEVRRTE